MDKLKCITKNSKKNQIVGIVLAVLSLIVCCVGFNLFAGIIFAALFLGFGFYKITLQNKKSRYIANFIWSLVIVIITFYVSVKMLHWGHLFQVGAYKWILNIMIIYMLSNLVFAVTANWKLSITVTTFLLAVLCMSNGFIYQFRGKELGPMDFASFGTALNVADQYEFKFSSNMIFAWCLWAVAAFAQVSVPAFPKGAKKRTRLTSIVLAIVYFMFIWVGSINIPIKMWETQGSEKNGYFLNFFMGIRDSFIDKPENYNPETIKTYAGNYSQTAQKPDPKDLPNIIIIMDESFADFRVIGSQEINSNVPITPFIDSLLEDTVRGYALSSVYGANTANSEFELLTGHSMAFLPENSVPYQQHIGGEIYSLPWLLNYYGYKSVSTHPYFADGWSRDSIYPKLGFSESTFIDSYPALNVIRKYISDQETFEFIIQRFNEKEKDSPMFMFCITMQNHGGYNYEGENYTQTVELEGYSREYPKAEQYFSVIRETDSAVKYLIEQLRNYDEDTVVLFFGDHFPKVENAFYKELHGGSFATLDEQMLKYKVPFFIWANYDIPEETVECTSLNFLSSRVLDVAGIEKPSFHSFLSELEKVIPAMNALGYYSISQNAFLPYDKAEGIEAEWINRYANLQYNDLFDEEHRSPEFYQQYIGFGTNLNLLNPVGSETE